MYSASRHSSTLVFKDQGSDVANFEFDSITCLLLINQLNMESLTNISNIEPQGLIYARYLETIKNLNDSRDCLTKQHLNGEAYSLLPEGGNLLLLYLIKENMVSEAKMRDLYQPLYNFIQEISIQIPDTVHVISANNVFLYEADSKVLGIQGYIMLLFGLNSYAFVLVGKQYSNGYHIQLVRPYQSIGGAVGNQGETMTTSLHAETATKQQRTGFPQHEITFLLGASMQQKIVKMKLTLRNDNSGPVAAVMTHFQEDILYEEQKSITSRISGFLSQKLLGRAVAPDQDPLNNDSCVRFMHIVAGFVVAITNKDLIVVRAADGNRVYSTEYYETFKEQSHNKDNEENMQLMRQLIQFRLIASSAVLLRESNQVCVNIFILKQQLIQSSQNTQAIMQTLTLHHTIFLAIQDGGADVVEISQDQRLVQAYELDKYSDSELLKAFSFGYEYFTPKGNDMTTLLFIEFKGGKIISVESSLSNMLCNIQTLRSFKLKGIGTRQDFDEQLQLQFISITIVNSNDIDQYLFYPTETQFSQVIPTGVLEQMGLSVEMLHATKSRAVTGQQMQRVVETKITRREDLKPKIFSLLDQVATYLFAAPTTKSQNDAIQQAKEAIYSDVKRIMLYFDKQQFLEQIIQIISESIDVQINGNQFAGINESQDEISNIFNDDGIVQRNLENKQKKMQVILEFLVANDLYDEQVDTDMRHLINDANFKLFTAKILRDIQENIKENNSQQRAQAYHGRFSLDMRLITKVIQATAAKEGFDQLQLKNLGVTSSNIVYSNISQIDHFFSTLIGICLDQNIGTIVSLDRNESAIDVLSHALNLLMQILRVYLEHKESLSLLESFFRADIDHINGIYKIIETLGESINDQRPDLQNLLMTFCECFMNFAKETGFTNSEPMEQWKIHLTLILEKCISKEIALEFCVNYQVKEILCRLVFDLGPKKYDVIRQCSEKWGAGFLQSAIQIIYQQELSIVKERKQQNFGEPYRGMQLFDIFEGYAVQELRQFLSIKNKKLLCLLSLRQQQANFANELFKHHVIPQTQIADSMKVLSSLALTNFENCVDSNIKMQQPEDGEYYAAKLNIATVHSQISPQNPQLSQQVNQQFVEAAYEKFTSDDPHRQESNLRKAMDLIHDESIVNPDSQANLANLAQLKNYAWRLIVREDENNLINLQKILPKDNDDQTIYTDNDILRAINQSIVFRLAEMYRHKPAVSLDEDNMRSLLSEYSDFAAPLKKIFANIQYDERVLFSQRPSMAAPLRTSLMNQSAFQSYQ